MLEALVKTTFIFIYFCPKLLNEFAFVFNFSQCVIPLLNSILIYCNSMVKLGYWHLPLSFSCFIVNLVFY